MWIDGSIYIEPCNKFWVTLIESNKLLHSSSSQTLNLFSLSFFDYFRIKNIDMLSEHNKFIFRFVILRWVFRSIVFSDLFLISSLFLAIFFFGFSFTTSFWFIFFDWVGRSVDSSLSCVLSVFSWRWWTLALWICWINRRRMSISPIPRVIRLIRMIILIIFIILIILVLFWFWIVSLLHLSFILGGDRFEWRWMCVTSWDSLMVWLLNLL